MELADEQKGLLDECLDAFQSLVGDRRTGKVLQGTIEGIIGAESLVCARIAAAFGGGGAAFGEELFGIAFGQAIALLLDQYGGGVWSGCFVRSTKAWCSSYYCLVTAATSRKCN